jgi:hypothetical protein
MTIQILAKRALAVCAALGFGAGAIFSGAIADFFRLGAMYAGSIVMIVMGLILPIATRRSIPLPTK